MPDSLQASPVHFTISTLLAAAIALFALALWAMFVGWVAYFTRLTSAGQGLCSGICLWLGIAFFASHLASSLAASPSEAQIGRVVCTLP